MPTFTRIPKPHPGKWGGPRPGSGRKAKAWNDKTVTVSTSIPRRLQAKLWVAAAERNLTVSQVIRELVEAAFGG